jgi:hypothetical protein
MKEQVVRATAYQRKNYHYPHSPPLQLTVLLGVVKDASQMERTFTAGIVDLKKKEILYIVASSRRLGVCR